MPPISRTPLPHEEASKLPLEQETTSKEPRFFNIPHRSPSPSEFGDEFGEEDYILSDLPGEIQRHLDEKGLEAFFVPPDGNCLFRALTFGPEWTKHELARVATSSYISGLKQSGNDLAIYFDDEQVEKIRQGFNEFD